MKGRVKILCLTAPHCCEIEPESAGRSGGAPWVRAECAEHISGALCAEFIVVRGPEPVAELLCSSVRPQTHTATVRSVAL